MSILEIAQLFYGFHRHFNEKKFNFALKGYKLNYTNENIKRYAMINHKIFTLCQRYNKQNIIILAIMNQLKYRQKANTINEFDEEDIRWFLHTLKFYLNDYEKDIDWLYENITCVDDVYNAHIMKKLSWYTLFFVLKFAGDNNNYITNNISVQRELEWIYKGMIIFKFDEDEIKKITEPLNKKLRMET